MTQQVIIFGAGGVARQAHDIIDALNDDAAERGDQLAFDFLGFVAKDDEEVDALEKRGPILGPDEVIKQLPKRVGYVIGIGSSLVRRKVQVLASEAGLVPVTLIHPRAYIGKYGISIGSGTIVCAMASITSDITLGEHVFIDQGVTLGHDAVLENFVSVLPGASVSGNAHIEEGVTVGTGSRILPGLRVGKNSIVGAGAVVTRNQPSNSVIVGIPARLAQQ